MLVYCICLNMGRRTFWLWAVHFLRALEPTLLGWAVSLSLYSPIDLVSSFFILHSFFLLLSLLVFNSFFPFFEDSRIGVYWFHCSVLPETPAKRKDSSSWLLFSGGGMGERQAEGHFGHSSLIWFYALLYPHLLQVELV